ncbi:MULTISPECIES: hypothetical protein [Chryseobacterium]|uniref:Uncharacterized protein n=2 Tax=Chryseobacterium TaxID=59732 RepID=A0A1M6Y2U0_9FLAO|nr:MULTISPECIES: hypothetical protein [Chryseobacterium]SFZ90703.1 hypothetical protein SAMN05216324_101477 [Chryseobacterium limigenitum]SHL12560.1 hypothetical protein SAMN05444267_101268 [Chryseobacterium polytrichastri]
MSKEKDVKKKSDKTAPLKTAKEKKADKIAKKNDRDNESKNTSA